MKYQKIFKIIALVMTLVLIGLYVRLMLSSDPIDLSFMDDYDNFDSYESLNEQMTAFQVSLEGQEVGYVLITSEDGFQSEIFVATYVNGYGLVEDVRVVQHNETPSYLDRVVGSSFINNFGEMSIADGFSADTNVDTVSKATISSTAITKAVQKAAVLAGEDYLNIEVTRPARDFKIKMIDLAIIIIFMLVIAANITKNKKLRLVTLFYAVIIMGFKFAGFVTYASFYQIITFNFPSFADNLRWYLLVVGSIAMVLIMGKNVYCAYICPYGALQELEHKFIKIDFKLKQKTVKILRLLPYALSYMALALALLTKSTGVLSYEPFSILFSSVGNELSWGIIFVTLFLSLVVMRPYCKFICPVGFVFNHIAKVKRIGGKLWKKRYQ